MPLNKPLSAPSGPEPHGPIRTIQALCALWALMGPYGPLKALWALIGPLSLRCFADDPLPPAILSNRCLFVNPLPLCQPVEAFPACQPVEAVPRFP